MEHGFWALSYLMFLTDKTMFLSESAAHKPAVRTFCETVVGSPPQLPLKEM